MVTPKPPRSRKADMNNGADAAPMAGLLRRALPMNDSVWRLPFDGTKIAVLADCHIHAGGPQFPEALFPRLQGVDLIVTLGDMGEREGLDQLQEIAPVLGVQGADDAEDLRTRRPYMVLTSGRYSIGCVFDAKAAGLATSSDPFQLADNADEVAKRIFGGMPEILLHAGTHKPGEASLGAKGTALNPGSAVLPAEGEPATFLRLKVGDDGVFGQIVWVA
jgi:putative phosphoesterase